MKKILKNLKTIFLIIKKYILQMITEKIDVEGTLYDINSTDITKDYFTGKYFPTKFREDLPTGIKLVQKRSRPRKNFTFSDSETIDYYDFEDANTDFRNPRPPSILICLYSIYEGEKVRIYLKESVEEFIKKHDLVKGINNPEVYYAKRELKIMDTPQPYRKFDNTYVKKNFNNLLQTEKSTDTDVIQLKKNIIQKNQQMGVESLTYQVFEGKKYTFGVEIETSLGRLEDVDVRDLNVKAVHDGSLRGPNGEDPLGGEYVTGVLTGDSGLNQIYEICRVLQANCKIDHRCGIHVHIGNLNWNKEDVVFSYILAELLQSEIFSMLPKSRRNNSYCRSLTPLVLQDLNYLVTSPSNTDYYSKIDMMYEKIYAEVSGIPSIAKNGLSRDMNKRIQHPKGAKCGFDKKSQRYCWLNYVTLLFDTKGIPDSHTLEFRPMSATLNFKKIRNWIKICVAFVYFVENFKNIIKQKKYTHTDGKMYPLDLELVIAKSYPKTGGALIDYIRERKKTFTTADESVDYVEVEKATKKTIKEVICVL